jgi:muramidase (phage lysozyme)
LGRGPDLKLIAAAIVAAAAFLLARRAADLAAAGEGEGGVIDDIGDTITSFYTDMTTNNLEALQHPNVAAFLAVIRRGEGTADANGYRRLVGGQLFDGYADHPRIRVFIPRLGQVSTAAGAYQFLESTWDEVAGKIGLTDFSPASQDIAAVERLRYRRALADVIAGRFDDALRKVSWEWASLPPFRYGGQGVITAEQARNLYAAAGGFFA